MKNQRYIPKQRDHIEMVMGDHLRNIKLGDSVTPEASGPQMVPVMSQDGQQSIGVGWQLTLWLAHNVLIGQDPVFVSVPVAGVLLDETQIKLITERLLEEARKIRAKAENPERVASAEEMMAALQRGQSANGASAE